jgi:HAD superfamily hydrolase (TIGR01549 family)
VPSGDRGEQLIKAVYFDLDDTLYDQLQPFQLAVQSTDLVQHINERLSIEDLYRRIRLHSDRLWEKHISGQMTLEELRIERAVAAFQDLSIEITAESASLLQQNYELEQTRLSLRDGVLELFEQLRESSIDIGLITNGPVLHQRNKIIALDLFNWVDEQVVYISDGIGIAKPDPNVFHYVQQRTAYLPDQMVYVGDAWHNDIAPSFRAGWLPIWLNPRKQLPHAEDIKVKFKECQSIHEVLPMIRLINNRRTGCLL